MRLPEAQVAHGVPGAIHSLPAVSIPDGLRHDSCNAPRLRRKANRPQFPRQRGRWVPEAVGVLRAQSSITGAASRCQPGVGPAESAQAYRGVLRNHRLLHVRRERTRTQGRLDALYK